MSDQQIAWKHRLKQRVWVNKTNDAIEDQREQLIQDVVEMGSCKRLGKARARVRSVRRKKWRDEQAKLAGTSLKDLIH